MRGAFLFIVVAASFSCFGQPSPGADFLKPGTSAAPTVSCDCTSYPFKPNPPCFGSCVGKLASTPTPDLAAVKGLDPGVSVSIKVLAANPKRETIDFSGMKGKADLEKAADRSLRNTDLRFQPSREFQLQR
jgi:hypothetical protein